MADDYGIGALSGAMVSTAVVAGSVVVTKSAIDAMTGHKHKKRKGRTVLGW